MIAAADYLAGSGVEALAAAMRYHGGYDGNPDELAAKWLADLTT